MDIVKLSYKEYKYNGEDAVYWFNDLGTLVQNNNVIGMMCTRGCKIINSRPFPLSQLFSEPFWHEWTIPRLREKFEGEIK